MVLKKCSVMLGSYFECLIFQLLWTLVKLTFHCQRLDQSTISSICPTTNPNLVSKEFMCANHDKQVKTEFNTVAAKFLKKNEVILDLIKGLRFC